MGQPARGQANYDAGFTGIFTLRRLPLVAMHSRDFLWVDSNGTQNSDGSFRRPFATIAAAMAKAGAGDTIFVKEAHTEAVIAAGGITVPAGVSIIGLGNGNRLPTINFTTATAATVLCSGANARLSNLRFTCGIASQARMIDITAKQVTVEGCEFAEGTQTGLSFIDIVAAANAADGARIVGNRFYAPTAGNYNHAVGLNEVQDKVEVVGNNILGNFALSGIHNITGKVLTNLTVDDNYVRNLTAGKQAINLISACTGVARNNRALAGDQTVEDMVLGSLKEAGNVDSTGIRDAGECFIVKKQLTSSAVTQAGVDITGVSVGGDLMIEDVIVQTGATGLAAGTNFTISHNNVSGLAAFFGETVANLGANKTIDITGASIAKIRSVLESGKKLTAKCTVADCTGAGTITVHVRFRRLAAGAHVIPT